MRLLKMLFVFLISLILIFPLSIKAQVSTISPVAPQAVTVEEVRQFIDEYAKRFTKLNLDEFMSLFSKEAVENRILPYADIRAAYKRTIETSRSILYKVKIYSIQTHTDSAFVSGRYEITQSFKKWIKKKVYRGNIQWDLVREDGSLKIREVNYGRDLQDD